LILSLVCLCHCSFGINTWIATNIQHNFTGLNYLGGRFSDTLFSIGSKYCFKVRECLNSSIQVVYFLFLPIVPIYHTQFSNNFQLYFISYVLSWYLYHQCSQNALVIRCGKLVDFYWADHLGSQVIARVKIPYICQPTTKTQLCLLAYKYSSSYMALNLCKNFFYTHFQPQLVHIQYGSVKWSKSTRLYKNIYI